MMDTLLIVKLVVVAQLYMCVKACQIVHCKYVKCIGCQLYTNKAAFEIVSRKWTPIPQALCPTSLSSFSY